MNDYIPQIDGYFVSLGDVVSFPEIGGCISNGRIKGWSPCGTMLYVAWVGAIATAEKQGLTSKKLRLTLAVAMLGPCVYFRLVTCLRKHRQQNSVINIS